MGPVSIQHRKGLHGFTQAHVIRQNTAPAHIVEVTQPLVTGQLVRPQHSGYAFGCRYFWYVFKFFESFKFFVECKTEFGFVSVFIELINHTHVVFAQSQFVCPAIAHFKQQRITFQPFVGQNTQSAIAQMNKGLFAGQCLFNICYAYPLFAKFYFNFSVEPI